MLCSATSRLSATSRETNGSDGDVRRQRAVALRLHLARRVRLAGDQLVEDRVGVHGDETEPVAGGAVVLGERVQADDVAGEVGQRAAEPLDERGVDGVGDDHEVGPLGQHEVAELDQLLRPDRPAVGVAGVDDDEDLDRRIEQLLEEGVVEAVRRVVGGAQLDDPEPEALEHRDLQVRREDRCRDGDGITGLDDVVGLQRLEHVGHRRRAALGPEHVEATGRTGIGAGHVDEVALHHLFEVVEHARRCGVAGAEDRPHQLVDPGVGLEPELRRRRSRSPRRGTAGRRPSSRPLASAMRRAIPAAGGTSPHSGWVLAAAASATASSPRRKKPARGSVASQFGWPRPASSSGCPDARAAATIAACISNVDGSAAGSSVFMGHHVLVRQHHVPRHLRPVPQRRRRACTPGRRRCRSRPTPRSPGR